MELNCEECAGCCLDWRPLASSEFDDHERRGRWQSLDDTYNLVPLTRGDVQSFLDAGLADALTPRLWEAAADRPSVSVDGVELAAIDGKPVFFLGIRKVPKPAAPFGRENAAWLSSCVFLDPTTLQCRIHGEDVYPTECAEYPGHNLKLETETECERVEASFGGKRLVDGDPPSELQGLLLGPQAIGEKVFVFPDPDRLDGVVERAVADDLTADDRARFVAAAVAGVPGTAETNRDAFDEAVDTARETASWVDAAIDEWRSLADRVDPEPSLAADVEDAREAPRTPGWRK